MLADPPQEIILVPFIKMSLINAEMTEKKNSSRKSTNTYKKEVTTFSTSTNQLTEDCNKITDMINM
jgi:hypothetical protein